MIHLLDVTGLDISLKTHSDLLTIMPGNKPSEKKKKKKQFVDRHSR